MYGSIGASLFLFGLVNCGTDAIRVSTAVPLILLKALNSSPTQQPLQVSISVTTTELVVRSENFPGFKHKSDLDPNSFI